MTVSVGRWLAMPWVRCQRGSGVTGTGHGAAGHHGELTGGLTCTSLASPDTGELTHRGAHGTRHLTYLKGRVQAAGYSFTTRWALGTRSAAKTTHEVQSSEGRAAVAAARASTDIASAGRSSPQDSRVESRVQSDARPTATPVSPGEGRGGGWSAGGGRSGPGQGSLTV